MVWGVIPGIQPKYNPPAPEPVPRSGWLNPIVPRGGLLEYRTGSAGVFIQVLKPSLKLDVTLKYIDQSLSSEKPSHKWLSGMSPTGVYIGMGGFLYVTFYMLLLFLLIVLNNLLSLQCDKFHDQLEYYH